MSVSAYGYLGWGVVIKDIGSYQKDTQKANPKLKPCCHKHQSLYCPECGTQQIISVKHNPMKELLEELEMENSIKVCQSESTTVIFSKIGLIQTSDCMYYDAKHNPMILDQSKEVDAKEFLKNFMAKYPLINAPINIMSYVSVG